MSKSDAQIAKDQNISRQAINNRRNEGWTQEEIEAGVREEPRKKRYNTNITQALGMSVKEKAAQEGVTPSAIYRRYHMARAGQPTRSTPRGRVNKESSAQ